VICPAPDELAGIAPDWSDEFDGAAGSPPDPGIWTAETGGNGWGNQELQYYTADGENASLDGAGNLIITVRRTDPEVRDGRYGGRGYTSARLISKGRVTLRYGLVQARMQLPDGRGIWPAFWMLGQDFDEAGWPRCGEIDVMENFGLDQQLVQGTVHGPGYSGAQGIAASHQAGFSLADGFHRYSVAWEPDRIRWFLDDQQYATVTPGDIRGHRWMFDHGFFLLLNVAVGGTPTVPPDRSVAFPQRLVVDYVRFWALRP
jgi:beta-glucanase (GH16 family)